MEVEIGCINTQVEDNRENTKVAELESTIKSDLEEGQRTLFDSYGVIE